MFAPLFVLLALSSTEALLQADAPAKPEARPWRDVEIRLGGYLAAIDSRFDVESGSGVGASVDAEDLLGLDNSVLSLRLEASVALAQRHRLYLDIFDVSRSSSETLGRDITFDGTTYATGTTVDSRMGLQVFNLTYGYSLFQDDRVDLAVTFGIHGLRTAIKLDSSSTGAQEEERFFLPIPLPGFRFDVALTPKLWLRQRAEFLWLGVNNYQGLMTDVSLGVEYALFDHVALGVGYNSVRMKLRMENDSFPAVDFAGEFDFQFSGLQFYLNIFF